MPGSRRSARQGPGLDQRLEGIVLAECGVVSSLKVSLTRLGVALGKPSSELNVELAWVL